jgi:hypothetical protein
MNQDQIKLKNAKVEKIYDEYLRKMDELKKEQNKILDEFLQKLEEEKIKEIRKKIG